MLNDVDGTPAAEVRYWLSQNRQYSVYCATLLAGNASQFYRNDAYGQVLCVTPSSTLPATTTITPISSAFTGRTYDNESLLMQFRRRTYAPIMGIFISRDPRGMFDGANLTTAYFVPEGTDPAGTSKLSQFCCWLRYQNIALRAKDDIHFTADEYGLGPNFDRDNFKGGNALLHCIIACRIARDLPSCSDEWNQREVGNAWGEVMDRANNNIGRNVSGDCGAGCLDAWRKGQLTCRDRSKPPKTVKCPPPSDKIDKLYECPVPYNWDGNGGCTLGLG